MLTPTLPRRGAQLSTKAVRKEEREGRKQCKGEERKIQFGQPLQHQLHQPQARLGPFSTKGRITIAYQNVNRSDSNTHALLHLARNHHVVIVAEPRIMTIPGTHTQVSHPAFQLTTPTNANTKIAIYRNKKLRKHSTTINNRHTIARIRLNMTTIYGLYLTSHDSIADLRDDLTTIKPTGRTMVVGDFHSHHTAWGADESNHRGASMGGIEQTKSARQLPGPNLLERGRTLNPGPSLDKHTHGRVTRRPQLRMDRQRPLHTRMGHHSSHTEHSHLQDD